MKKQIAKIYVTSCGEELREAKDMFEKQKTHFCEFFFAEVLSRKEIKESWKCIDFSYKVNALDEFYEDIEVDKFLSLNVCTVYGVKKIYKVKKNISFNVPQKFLKYL